MSRILWIPSHFDIVENDLVDMLVFNAAGDPDFDGNAICAPVEISHIKKVIKRAVRVHFALAWETSPQSPMLHELFPVPPFNRLHICGVVSSQGNFLVSGLVVVRATLSHIVMVSLRMLTVIVVSSQMGNMPLTLPNMLFCGVQMASWSFWFSFFLRHHGSHW